MVVGLMPGRPIRLVAMRRREALDGDAFRRHWRDRHGPLMAAVPAVVYLQNHVADGPAVAWAVDGFAWIDMPQRPGSSIAAAAAHDLANFVGASTRLLCAAELVVTPPAHLTAKVLQVVHPVDMVRRNPQESEALAEHLCALLRVQGLAGCRRNVVTGALPAADPRIGELGLKALCVVEVWFADLRVARSALASQSWTAMRERAGEMGYATEDYLAEEFRIA